MSKRRDVDLIQDIIESIERIIFYTHNMEYANFVKDYKTQDAVIRNIEILGEAAKLISLNLKDDYPDISWKNIAGTRDKLVHDYFGINIDIVWNIIKEDIPELSQNIKQILQNLK